MLATNESFPGMGFELDFTRLVAHDNASNRPRPLTGHELFSMFPAPPPKHLADPTSLYFGKEEREFFARLHHPKFDAASDPKQEYDRHAQRSLPPLVSPRHRRPDANPDDFPPSPWTSFTPIETFSGGPNGLSAVDSDQGLWRQRSRAPDMRSLEKQRTTKKPTFFCKYEGCHSRVTGFTTQRMLQRHYTDKHSGKEIRCPHCPARYSDSTSIPRHIREKHKDVADLEGYNAVQA